MESSTFLKKISRQIALTKTLDSYYTEFKSTNGSNTDQLLYNLFFNGQLSNNQMVNMLYILANCCTTTEELLGDLLQQFKTNPNPELRQFSIRLLRSLMNYSNKILQEFLAHFKNEQSISIRIYLAVSFRSYEISFNDLKKLYDCETDLSVKVELVYAIGLISDIGFAYRELKILSKQEEINKREQYEVYKKILFYLEDLSVKYQYKFPAIKSNTNSNIEEVVYIKEYLEKIWKLIQSSKFPFWKFFIITLSINISLVLSDFLIEMICSNNHFVKNWNIFTFVGISLIVFFTILISFLTYKIQKLDSKRLN